MQLIRGEIALANKLVEIYFDLFKLHMEQSEMESKLLDLILIGMYLISNNIFFSLYVFVLYLILHLILGLSRAFPYSQVEEEV